MPAASSSANGFVPNFVRSSSQPSTHPGTDQLSGPRVGDLVEPAVLEEFAGVACSGAPAAGVEAVELLRLRVPDDGEQVAADAARHRLHEAHRGVGGDGRVDGVAAVLQHVEPDLRGERVAGGDHAVVGDRLGPRPDLAVGDPSVAEQEDGDEERTFHGLFRGSVACREVPPLIAERGGEGKDRRDDHTRSFPDTINLERASVGDEGAKHLAEIETPTFLNRDDTKTDGRRPEPPDGAAEARAAART